MIEHLDVRCAGQFGTAGIVLTLSNATLRDTFGTVPIEGTVQFPMYLALASAVGIACGGCLAMWEEARAENTLEARSTRRP